MKKILLTGFEPFGGEDINPSWEVVKRIKNKDAIKAILPVSFIDAPKKLSELIKEHNPDFVFCLGQAGGIKSLSPEFVAINYMKANCADNYNYKPSGIKIDKKDKEAYFTKLDLEKIIQLFSKENIPSRISYSAGTYVCNTIFFRLLQLCEKSKNNMKGTFIHLPWLPEQVKKEGDFSLDLGKMTSAIEKMLLIDF